MSADREAAPVAWRWRYTTQSNRKWTYAHEAPKPYPGIEIEPLYAHPPQDKVTDERREVVDVESLMRVVKASMDLDWAEPEVMKKQGMKALHFALLGVPQRTMLAVKDLHDGLGRVSIHDALAAPVPVEGRGGEAHTCDSDDCGSCLQDDGTCAIDRSLAASTSQLHPDTAEAARAVLHALQADGTIDRGQIASVIRAMLSNEGRGESVESQHFQLNTRTWNKP